MKEEPKILIVGGSMAGFLAGISACENNVYPTIIEEHSTVGKFGKCTGVMSLNGMKNLGIKYHNCVSNYVNGAFIYSGDCEFKVQAKNDIASILYRQKLDELLGDLAVSKGCELKTNEKFMEGKQEEHIKIKTNKGEYLGTHLIGCDGANSAVAASFGFPNIGKKDYAICNEVEIEKTVPKEKNKVEVFLDNEILEGFFGWTVPVNEETVRIGFGVTDPKKFSIAKTRFYQDKRIKHHFEKGKTIREFSHVIPLKVREKTQKGRIFLAGDSAGQAKATTGGGVIIGGACAKIAGRTASLNRSDYEEEWKKKYGSTLSRHRTIRKILDVPNNFLLETGLKIFKNLGGEKIVSNYGDMDFITINSRVVD